MASTTNITIQFHSYSIEDFCHWRAVGWTAGLLGLSVDAFKLPFFIKLEIWLVL
jgi:hypothetical protein